MSLITFRGETCKLFQMNMYSHDYTQPNIFKLVRVEHFNCFESRVSIFFFRGTSEKKAHI